MAKRNRDVLAELADVLAEGADPSGDYFEKVINSGWTGKPSSKAKTRYKKVDGHNRQKLVIDAITQAVGVDDCHIFRITKTKGVILKTPGSSSSCTTRVPTPRRSARPPRT